MTTNETSVQVRVAHALQADPVDVATLKRICCEEGLGRFCSPHVRMVVWAKILGVNEFVLEDHRKHIVKNHKFFDIINRDVDRSLYAFTRGKSQSYSTNKRSQLWEVIHALVCKHSPWLNYYQGMHDVCSVFVMLSSGSASTHSTSTTTAQSLKKNATQTQTPELAARNGTHVWQKSVKHHSRSAKKLATKNELVVPTTVSSRLAFALAERLYLGHLRDHVRETFNNTTQQLHLIFKIVQRCDAEMGGFFNAIELPPFFALSGVITWMSHDLDLLAEVCRLFDAFIASHPALVLYYWAALIIIGRDKILELPPDVAIVHSVLQKLPGQIPVDTALARALQLFRAYPIKSILPFARLSPFSRRHPFWLYPFPWCSLCQRPSHVLKQELANVELAPTGEATIDSLSHEVHAPIYIPDEGFAFVAHSIVPSVVHHSRRQRLARLRREQLWKWFFGMAADLSVLVTTFVVVVAVMLALLQRCGLVAIDFDFGVLRL